MRNPKLWGALLTAAVLGVAGLAIAKNTDAHCSGKIVCPATGETICADQCPLRD